MGYHRLWIPTGILVYAVRASILSADIFGAKKSSMSDPMRTEPQKKGEHSDTKGGHGGWSVGRSDSYADICGGLKKF